MKNLLSMSAVGFIFFAPLSVANNNIYKCMGPEGQIEYQEEPCDLSSKTDVITVQKVDPKVIEEARNKLAKDLEQQTNYEQELAKQNDAKAKQALEERRINALERDAVANETSANSLQNQPYGQNYNNNDPRNYYYPWPNAPYRQSVPNNNQQNIKPTKQRRNVYKESINSTQFPNKFR